MMGVVLLIVTGAAFGWLATIILKIEQAQRILAKMGIGIAGALAAGVIINPALGLGSVLNGSLGPVGFGVAMLGASAALAASHYMPRRRAH